MRTQVRVQIIIQLSYSHFLGSLSEHSSHKEAASDGGWADRDTAAKWFLTLDTPMNESTPVDPLRLGYSIGSQYTINDCTVEKKSPPNALALIYHQYSPAGRLITAGAWYFLGFVCLLAAAVAAMDKLLLTQEADTLAAPKQRKSKTD